MTQQALTYREHGEYQSRRPFSGAGAGLIYDLVAVDSWQFTVRNRLQRLVRLRPGWDGYNSGPVSPSVATFVLELLSSVMRAHSPAPSIVPTAGGGVQIEWHEAGLDIELYVPRPLKAEIYVHYSDGRPDLESELTADFSTLSSVLDELG